MIKLIQLGENEFVEITKTKGLITLYKSDVSNDYHIEFSISDWKKISEFIDNNPED